ncbi:MAG TPA: hypothetical protein VFM15_09350, partial [Gammaproteobacteria bacterium]|nr:hypothetical protein [Gammaproteobacteria bacterium]
HPGGRQIFAPAKSALPTSLWVAHGMTRARDGAVLDRELDSGGCRKQQIKPCFFRQACESHAIGLKIKRFTTGENAVPGDETDASCWKSPQADADSVNTSRVPIGVGVSYPARY